MFNKKKTSKEWSKKFKKDCELDQTILTKKVTI